MSVKARLILVWVSLILSWVLLWANMTGDLSNVFTWLSFLFFGVVYSVVLERLTTAHVGVRGLFVASGLGFFYLAWSVFLALYGFNTIVLTIPSILGIVFLIAVLLGVSWLCFMHLLSYGKILSEHDEDDDF